VTGLREGAERVDDAVVGGDEAVVVLELVLPVAGEQPLRFGVVGGVLAEHRLQRPADAGAPFLVAGGAALETDEGVARRAEDQLDRVDEGAVEVEEEGSRSSWVGMGHTEVCGAVGLGGSLRE